MPLLPSRLGVDGVDLLLKDRTGAFTDCLRDFRVGLAASSSATASSVAAAAADGKGEAGNRTAKGGVADARAGAGKSGGKPAAGPDGGGFGRSWGSGSSQRSSGGSAAGGGEWGAFRLPLPPVACCSTEAFLLGNVVAFGTKLSVDGGRASGGRGGGVGLDAASQEKPGRRDQREFMRAATSLLELRVRDFTDGDYSMYQIRK